LPMGYGVRGPDVPSKNFALQWQLEMTVHGMNGPSKSYFQSRPSVHLPHLRFLPKIRVWLSNSLAHVGFQPTMTWVSAIGVIAPIKGRVRSNKK
jgi:hypothetical protein